jgi:hypothetical protein
MVFGHDLLGIIQGDDVDIHRFRILDLSIANLGPTIAAKQAKTPR